MKAKKVKRQVQFSPRKKSTEPIVINTTPGSKSKRQLRGGCCGKKRT